MVGCDDFSRHHTSPRVQGRRVDREHGELATGDPWATMSAKSSDRVAFADHGLHLMTVAGVVKCAPGIEPPGAHRYAPASAAV